MFFPSFPFPGEDIYVTSQYVPDIIRVQTGDRLSDIVKDIALHQDLGAITRVDGRVHAVI